MRLCVCMLPVLLCGMGEWVVSCSIHTAVGIRRGGGPLPADGRGGGMLEINGKIQVQLSTDICIHIFQILSIFCKHA